MMMTMERCMSIDRISAAGSWATCEGDRENKKQEQQNMSSYLPILAEMSGSIHVGLAALGAALGVGLIGMKASEAVGRNPGAATPILVQAILSTAFAEGIVFFAIYLAGK